jgi:hypothetical protein
MKALCQYISEKQDTNLENTQMEIDDMKANETNQMPKLNADAIKSIIINNITTKSRTNNICVT